MVLFCMIAIILTVWFIGKFLKWLGNNLTEISHKRQEIRYRSTVAWSGETVVETRQRAKNTRDQIQNLREVNTNDYITRVRREIDDLTGS